MCVCCTLIASRLASCVEVTPSIRDRQVCVCVEDKKEARINKEM